MSPAGSLAPMWCDVLCVTFLSGGSHCLIYASCSRCIDCYLKFDHNFLSQQISSPASFLNHISLPERVGVGGKETSQGDVWIPPFTFQLLESCHLQGDSLSSTQGESPGLSSSCCQATRKFQSDAAHWTEGGIWLSFHASTDTPFWDCAKARSI